MAQSGESLVIRRRPDTTLKLTPVYADAFDVPQLGLVIFHRDGGRVSGLSVSQDRVWDLRFARQNQALVSAWRTAGMAVEVNEAANREPDIALFETVMAAARAFAPDAVVGLPPDPSREEQF